jgi:hypothetical protein
LIGKNCSHIRLKIQKQLSFGVLALFGFFHGSQELVQMCMKKNPDNKFYKETKREKNTS